VTIVIAAMAPEVGFATIVHRLATAQSEQASTARADGLFRPGGCGSDLFSVGCLCDFHGTSAFTF
jgi:hypothetical protein